MARNPVREVPANYAETLRLIVTEGRLLLWLNLMALIPIVIALPLLAWWQSFAIAQRGSIASPVLDQLGLLADIPLALLALVGVLLLHEATHGVMIALVGHRPRFGAKLDKGVLYATADNALFRRDEYVAVALAPLIVLTVIGLAGMYVVPDRLGYFIGLAVLINASGAVGDLWMTWVTLRYPREALVRDKEDGMIIYTPQEA